MGVASLEDTPEVDELDVEAATLEVALEEEEDVLGSIVEEGIILVDVEEVLGGELVEGMTEKEGDKLGARVDDSGDGVVKGGVVEEDGVGVGDDVGTVDDALPAASAFTIPAPRVGRGTSCAAC